MSSRDSRIKYIISNGRIISGTDGPSPWVWRRYTGTNPHSRHVHISVKASKSAYDDTQPWKIGGPKTAARSVLPTTGSPCSDVRCVQADLVALGYHEVGDIDGLIGGRTRGAIAAFMNDRSEVAATSITPTVVAEIGKAKAEGWSRPVAPTRAFATAKDIAPKIEAVKQNGWSRFWSKVLAIPSTVGAAIWGVTDAIPAAHDVAAPYISIAREYANVVPGWVWLLVVAAVGFAIWRSTNKGESATVADYQSGRLS